MNISWPNIFRVAAVLGSGVILPILVNKTREIKNIPTEICLFNFGYGCCAFIDWDFAIRAGFNVYPNFPHELSTVPCSIPLLILSGIQILIFYSLRTGWFQLRLNAPQPGVKYLFGFLAVFLALLSLLTLLTSELFWR
jgi:hypothetical protein